MAGNRVGKTEAGGVEVTYHATGEYPDWWEGRRFDRPVSVLAAGDTGQTTRDIIQKKLCGGKYGTDKWGSGLIPKDCLGKPTIKQGISDAYAEVPVLHKPTGEWSVIKLRSYDQGRRCFQGTEEDVVWMDEEVPLEVYEEALVRLMTTKGIFILTFTPLNGLTELVLLFLQDCGEGKQAIGDEASPKYMVQAGWDHAPHLDQEDKDKLAVSFKSRPHQLKARREGIPALGAGAVYPYDRPDIEVTPFRIPSHWPRAYAMDVGWNKTAVIWGALDPENDVLYLYSEHYMGETRPAEHVVSINARGKWMLGTIDPAAKGRSQRDGERLIDDYVLAGLTLIPADNAVEAGIMLCNERFSTGRLKVFSNLSAWWFEFGLYRRDEKNWHVVKKNDHAMDAMRYLVMMLREILKVPPLTGAKIQRPADGAGNWMAR